MSRESWRSALDLLVRKKIITDQEAEEVRAELTKQVSETSGGKWKLSSPITELELYGDARLRYEIRNGEDQTDDTEQRNRQRYRLRLGLRGILADDWFFGVRLETSTSSRSTNVTFGDESSGGPFAKGSDGIFVGQAYLGYKGFKDVTLMAGRMPNPLISTFMVWDPDINPEGLAEQWRHTFTFGGAGSQSFSYSKEGTPLPAGKKKSDESNLKIDIFVNLGQFVYDDANPENPLGPRATTTGNGGHQLIPNTDAFLLAWQVGARFIFPKTLYAQIAPTFYNYTGNGDTFNIHFQGGSPSVSNSTSVNQNQTGINSLLIFDLPGEVGWKLGDLPMRLFADFAVNLDGDDRAAAAGHPGKGDQRYAYQVGLGIGQLKKKGDWQLNVFWQRQDQYALDPNLVDTEFWDSKLNLQGVGVTFGYMLSDAVWVQLLYGYAEQADGALGTGRLGRYRDQSGQEFSTLSGRFEREVLGTRARQVYAIVTLPSSGRNNRFLVCGGREESGGGTALDSRSKPAANAAVQKEKNANQKTRSYRNHLKFCCCPDVEVARARCRCAARSAG